MNPLPPRGQRPSRRPAVAEQLVHLAPHPLDVDQQVSLSRHRRIGYPRQTARPRRTRPRPRSRPARRRPPRRLRPSASRVELVGDVGEHEPPDAGLAGRAAPPRRAHVARPEPDRVGQRRLGEQHVGPARGGDQLVGVAPVGAEDDPRARRSRELDRVGRRRCAGPGGAVTVEPADSSRRPARTPRARRRRRSGPSSIPGAEPPEDRPAPAGAISLGARAALGRPPGRT